MKIFLKILTMFFFTISPTFASVTDIHVGGGTSLIGETGQDIYGIGYGATGYFDNAFYLGVSIDAEFINTIGKASVNYGGDFKWGLSFSRNTSFYGIVAMIGQSLYDSSTAIGWGYGGGFEYRFGKPFTLALEYKKYDVENAYGFKYDFSSTQMKIRYNFFH